MSFLDAAISSPGCTRTAPGKVNLYFAVGPVRPDGYHDVASLYAAVDLYESVTARWAPADQGITMTTTLRPGSFLEAQCECGEFDPDTIPNDHRNLAVRAASAVLRAVGLEGIVGLRLDVVKEIPVAGGMAGGSADAAAALKAVNALIAETRETLPWPEPGENESSAGQERGPFVVHGSLTERELAEIGAGLGADVPFALLGGAAIGTGTGIELEPVEIGADLSIELFPARFGLTTPEVFRELDRQRAAGIDGETHRQASEAEPLCVPDQLIQALAHPGVLPEDLVGLVHNDLQTASVALAPELGEKLGLLSSAGAVCMVSGSGPTVLRIGGPASTGLSAGTRISEMTNPGIANIEWVGGVIRTRILRTLR